MPGKYVYLFELDSVRCSDREIIAGQKALYDEIVLNGNIVVLSYNQFIESRAFFSFLSETDPVRKKYGKDLMKLIGAGRICVSQYGDCRSVSQYLINTVDRDSEYIYSGLPIKSSQKRLSALMKRCLIYSDLSELSDLIEGKRSTEDLRDLFTECVRDDTGKVTEHPSEMSIGAMKENLCQLKNVLTDVLRMGLFEHIYIAPRSTEEVDRLRLDKLIRIISRLDIQDASFRRATEILKRMAAFQKHSNSRSDYLKELKDTGGEHLDRQYLEALINLLYNYVCEYSICNTAKRYDVSELTGDIDQKKQISLEDIPSFYRDLKRRFSDYWQDGKDADRRFLVSENSRFDPFDSYDELPDFSMDVELLDYYEKPEKNASEIYRYEYQLCQQRNEQKNTVLSAIKKTLSFAYRCILIACVIELIFSRCQDIVTSWISGILPVNSAVINIPLTGIETIVFLFVTELITTYLGEKHPDILSLSDSLGKISKLRREFRYIRDREIPPEEEEPELLRAEPCASSAPIDFITTDQMRRYLAYKKKCLRDGNRIFTESVLPAQPEAAAAALSSVRNAEPGELFLADTSDRRILKQLVRDEELHSRSYGMIYQSPFNTVLVDPVVNISASPQNIFPYERVIPTRGDGSVIMTRCRGSFLLLRQFRHALGSWQYSFPRGFAEPDDRDPVDTARRELEEELGARCIDDPIFLGKIAPDSGLTSRQTSIFFADIDSYIEKMGYEEIGQIRLVSEEELQKLIRSGELNDGYSIGAYELFRLYRKARPEMKA